MKLSDEDVERIAQRVAELVGHQTIINMPPAPAYPVYPFGVPPLPQYGYPWQITCNTYSGGFRV